MQHLPRPDRPLARRHRAPLWIARVAQRRADRHNDRAFPPGTSPTKETRVRAQVEQTLEVIRPALQADGGDVVLRDVDEATGIVTVTLVGACGTCPASTQTLKAGIERIMRDRVEGVTEVVAV